MLLVLMIGLILKKKIQS